MSSKSCSHGMDGLNGRYPFYPVARKRKNKYNNEKVQIDGMIFDSKKEAGRFQELRLLERGGIISGLKTQVRFLICPKEGGNKRTRYYVADFVYCEGGKMVIEDVKSEITRKNPVYSLKKALVQWLYPEYSFRET